jgi:hypothetical protein
MPQGLFYVRAMKRTMLLQLAVLLMGFAFTSCASTPEKKPVGPVSETSQIPWNLPVAGQGQGQFGMMPQNQYRR